MSLQFSLWISPAVICVLACLSVADEAKESAPRVTPAANSDKATSEQQKLFDTYRAAVERKDWTAVVALLSDDAAERVCKQILRKINDDLYGSDDRAESSIAVIRWLQRANRAKAESFLKRHDLGDVDPEDLTELKADRRALLVDAQKSLNVRILPDFKPTLSRLMIDRDLAWAHAAYTVAKPARVTPIGFVKKEGKWLIYVPPDGWNDQRPSSDDEPVDQGGGEDIDWPKWTEPKEGKEVPGFVNETGEKNLKLMQGKWRILSLLADGEQMTADPDEPGGWTIAENRVSYRSGKYDRIKLDGSKTPGHMDVHSYDFEGKLTLMHAIYEIDGDTMRVCVDVEEKGRPGDFTCQFKSGRRSFVLERVK